jgi:AAA+ superfamily predicted ATPase
VIDVPAVNGVRRRIRSMIGMKQVEGQVEDLIDTAIAREHKKELGLPVEPRRMHMVFSGPPGTGKTTVAQEIAPLYKALGLIPGTDGRVPGDFLVVKRQDLVGKYTGWTADKTQKVFDKARGGVLFVDEAYTLKHGEQDDFGQEAIDALMEQMEAHRDDTVVIFAGYPDKLEPFLASNPGLKSRVPTTINFPKYSNQDLSKIMAGKIKAGGFTPQPAAHKALRRAVTSAGADGNAREIDTLYGHIATAVDRRTSGAFREAGKRPPRHEFEQITPADVQAGFDAHQAGKFSAAPKRAGKGRLVKA